MFGCAPGSRPAPLPAGLATALQPAPSSCGCAIFHSPTFSLQPHRYPSAMSSLCSQGITLQPRRSISTPGRFSHNKPAFPNDPSALSGRSTPGGRPTYTANRLSAAAPSHHPARIGLPHHARPSSGTPFSPPPTSPRGIGCPAPSRSRSRPTRPPSPLITTHTLTCTHDSPLRNKPPLPCSAPSPSPPGPGPDRTQKNARTTQGAGVGITE